MKNTFAMNVYRRHTSKLDAYQQNRALKKVLILSFPLIHARSVTIWTSDLVNPQFWFGVKLQIRSMDGHSSMILVRLPTLFVDIQTPKPRHVIVAFVPILYNSTYWTRPRGIVCHSPSSSLWGLDRQNVLKGLLMVFGYMANSVRGVLMAEIFNGPCFIVPGDLPKGDLITLRHLLSLNTPLYGQEQVYFSEKELSSFLQTCPRHFDQWLLVAKDFKDFAWGRKNFPSNLSTDDLNGLSLFLSLN